MNNFRLKMDQSSISEFPFTPLFAFKFSLLNCSFFHPPQKSIDQIRAILKENGDFLIQDSKGPKLVLCIRIDSKILEFPICIVQKGGTLLQFEFAQNIFHSLEHLAIFFSKRRNFICTEAGERIHLCRPIYRQKYAGRLGHGECLGLRDSIRPTKIHPSFVRSLRPEFANSKEIVDDLEKLVSLDHRNLVRLRDFFLLPSISPSPLIFLRFDQIQGAHSLFEHLFDQKGPLNLRQYIKWAYQAAKGLNFLMERGILHRRLNARSSLLDSLQNLRLSDFWTENDPGDFGLFQGKNAHLAHHSVHPEAILYKDGWRYLPPETLLNGQFDSISQVWSFALFIWQIFTHCQFAGNRIFYSSLAEFLSVTGGRDDPFYLPGHLDEKEAQKGMPEERRRKQIFVCASQRLPHAPDSLAQIIPKALLPDRPQRPFFSQLFRIVESEKRILDLANVLGLLL